MSELPDQSGPIEVTEAAKRHLETAARANGLWRFGVRVRLVGKDATRGFDLSFDELPDRGDVILRSAGLKLFVASDAVDLIPEGTVIDWRGGFVFRQRGAK